MTPNELADALSDEAMLASKRAVVLRALPYRGKAAILRDTVADELDRQSVRLIGMFDMALPDDPIAEPAGDVQAQANAWLEVCDLLEEIDPEWSQRAGLGVNNAIYAIRRLAQPQREDLSALIAQARREYRDSDAAGDVLDWLEEQIGEQPQRQGDAVDQWKCRSCGCEHGIAGEPSWTHGKEHEAEANWRCDRCDHEQPIKLWETKPASAAVAFEVGQRVIWACDVSGEHLGRVVRITPGHTAYFISLDDGTYVENADASALSAAPDRSQSGGGA